MGKALFGQGGRRLQHQILRGLAVLVLLCLKGCGEPTPTLSIATGGPAGLYYPFGGGMASLWSARLAGVNVKAEVTGGSVINVIQVARQESDLGIAMADVVSAAYAGHGRFLQPLPLRVLFAAYPNVVHLLTLADSGVNDLQALRGKRVSIGAQGSGTAVAAENVLLGAGIDSADIAIRYLSFAETTSALKDGTIDAGFVVGGLGIAAVTELAVTRAMRIIPIDGAELAEIVKQFPAYAGYTIPADTYTGVDQDVATIGIWSVVVVHADMSAELAYRLTCQVYAGQAELRQVSRVADFVTVDNIRRLASVPLHPGSEWFVQAPTTDCDAIPNPAPIPTAESALQPVAISSTLGAPPKPPFGTPLSVSDRTALRIVDGSLLSAES